MRYFIGIDIGTTHSKAVVADEKAAVVFETKKGYPFSQPLPGYHEQDADQIFAAVWEVLEEAVAAVADKENIIAVSFSAAMHSIMAVDESGQPLSPLLTWADTRSKGFASLLKNTEEGDRIYRQTGTPIHPMSPLCKIAWIREELPAVFAKTHKFISGKEYIWYKLTGAFEVDHSLASATGLFDIHKREWSKAALDFAGITGQQLSTPVSVLYSSPDFKERKSIPGLSPATILLAGASDGLLANLGSAAVLPAEMALTIGTSGAVRVLKNKPVANKGQSLFHYAAFEGHFLSGGAINNGGIVLQWFMDTFIHDSSGATLTEWLDKAAAVPAGSEGLIFLPYVYGERAPVWDAEAKGAFVGIQSGHTKAHFLRAVLEGVAFSLLQIMEAIEESGEQIDTVYASGGFISSALWLQIVTDVLQKKVKVSHAADASAMGAVYLAMYATGRIKEWNDVKSFVHTDEELLPSTAAGKVYLENYRIYSGLYEGFKGLMV